MPEINYKGRINIYSRYEYYKKRREELRMRGTALSNRRKLLNLMYRPFQRPPRYDQFSDDLIITFD